MKKGRFLWSAHRITERQKAGKARNIKGKQLKNSRSTVSKQHVVLLSSQRDNKYEIKTTSDLAVFNFVITKRTRLCVVQKLRAMGVRLRLE